MGKGCQWFIQEQEGWQLVKQEQEQERAKKGNLGFSFPTLPTFGGSSSPTFPKLATTVSGSVLDLEKRG